MCSRTVTFAFSLALAGAIGCGAPEAADAEDGTSALSGAPSADRERANANANYAAMVRIRDRYRSLEARELAPTSFEASERDDWGRSMRVGTFPYLQDQVTSWVWRSESVWMREERLRSGTGGSIYVFFFDKPEGQRDYRYLGNLHQVGRTVTWRYAAGPQNENPLDPR